MIASFCQKIETFRNLWAAFSQSGTFFPIIENELTVKIETGFLFHAQKIVDWFEIFRVLRINFGFIWLIVRSKNEYFKLQFFSDIIWYASVFFYSVICELFTYALHTYTHWRFEYKSGISFCGLVALTNCLKRWRDCVSLCANVLVLLLIVFSSWVQSSRNKHIDITSRIHIIHNNNNT